MGSICYGGVTLYESASCGRRKRRHRRVSRRCNTGDIPLPRSLTRYARSFGCGERYRLTNDEVTRWSGGQERPEKGYGVAVFP